MKASEAKKIADDSGKSVQQHLLNVALNKIKSEAGKNIYSVKFVYPKHQSDYIKTELEKLDYKVTSSVSVTEPNQFDLIIDFSSPDK